MSEPPVSVSTLQSVEEVRYRTAVMADVEAIHGLIEDASRSTTVLPRPQAEIQQMLGNFVVAEAAGGAIVGCGALGLFTAHLAEVRSLVVADGLRGRGIGAGVVRTLVEEARRRGIKRVFALTDNPLFFQRLGFTLTSKATLPHKVWNECVHCPKFLTCTEEAVDMFLCPGAAAEPGVITLEEPETGDDTSED